MSGGKRERQPAAGRLLRRRLGTACRYAPLMTGTIRCQHLSRRIWWRIAGPSRGGSFVQTLVVTDIATGWTECAPLLVREQRLGELRKSLPFPLLGLDTDTGSVFMNETVRDYCLQLG